MRGFLKLGKWVVISSGVGVVAHCTSSSSPSTPTHKWDYNWDKREPYSLVKQSKKKSSTQSDVYSQQLETQKSKAIRHLILIRHGQYHLNASMDCDRTLTNMGERQAEETGKRLKSLGVDFNSITSSNMKRAMQTAEIIRKEIGMEEDKLESDSMLREGAPAPAEPPVSNWHPELHQYYEDGARIEAAFRKYFHRADPKQVEDSYEVIVCHANVIRYFCCRALQFPGEAWLRISLNHASLTCLSITASGRVILRTLGDSGHLPTHMLSTS